MEHHFFTLIIEGTTEKALYDASEVNFGLIQEKSIYDRDSLKKELFSYNKVSVYLFRANPIGLCSYYVKTHCSIE
jgi:hypothetical protein